MMGMQAVNGMPSLTDPGWLIAATAVDAEVTADEPTFNRWLFLSEDDYLRNGLGLQPKRNAAASHATAT